MPPIHVAQATLREIRLPLREPFIISSGHMDNRRILLLQLRDAAGAEAWSECVAAAQPNYSPETVDTAWLMLADWLLPRVLGRSFDGPEAVAAALDVGVQGHPMAKGALEMGCWGLAAELERVSLAKLIGGTMERIPVGISIGIQESVEAVVAKARASADEGYRRIKLKIRPGQDIDYVAAVREALGPDMLLSVDANAAYTLEDADHLARLDAFDLVMIEQPLASTDLYRHARLQERLRTSLCLDESIVGPHSAEDMLAMGSARIVNIKPGRVGGFTASRRIHDIARDAGVPVWCGGMLESGIGRAYNVALASLPNFTLPGDVSPSHRYWTRDVVVPEWTMSEDGFVTVPVGRPGIGVDVDADRIDDLTVRVESFDSAGVGV